MPNPELFHTEDCGLSLLCRCCRGSICEQRLSKSDRLKVELNFWTYAYGAHPHDRSMANSKRQLKHRVGDWSLRVIRWVRLLQIG
jgi:hypothetical protein